MSLVCYNCNSELDDFYTFTDLKLVNKTEDMDCYKYIERKVSSMELRKQKKSVICKSCNKETDVYFPDEIIEIKNKQKINKDLDKKPENVFSKYESF